MSVFMEVIEWTDQSGHEIIRRVPAEGSVDIKFGAQLIVREHQAAIFVANGKGLDVMGPGRHTLTTMNLPILTKMLALPWGFTSPFRCEVYFVNTTVLTNMRWGTRDPVAFRDSVLGLIRLRAFGAYSMQVAQPLLCLNTLVGARGSFSTQDIEDYLRDVIVSRLNDFLGETVDNLFDLPQYYDEMGVAVKARLVEDFRKYGIELVDFYITRITPPEEVQKMIDERSGMAAVGNLDHFLKFKTAKALGDAARGNPEVQSAMGIGMGLGMGTLLPGMLYNVIGSDAATPQQIAARGSVNCPECHGEVSLDSRFCCHCGHQMVVISKCPRCQKNLTVKAKFCSSCGHDLHTEALRCRSCQETLPPETRFCFHCGETVRP